MNVVVGVDLGGTKIFASAIDTAASGTDAVLADVKRSTPTTSADDIVEAVAETVRDVARQVGRNPSSVGVGTPGVVAEGDGTVQYAPNLAGFDRPVDLGGRLADALGLPVRVGNDVNVAALGEVTFGAAKGRSDVLAVWMGTGLGAGLILDGRLRIGPTGLAGELGHVVVVPDGETCGCGGRGHVEAYIGRRSLEARARRRHAAGESTMLVDLAGDKRMKSKVFRNAYDAGDAVTHELINRGIDVLAVAIANTVVTVDVEVVVIGGGLGERFADVAVDRITRSLAALRYAGTPPSVVPATLGDHAGPLGAAALATS